jgi:PKD repeat protein
MPALGTPQISVVDVDRQVVGDILLYPAPELTLAEADGAEARVVETFAFDAVSYNTDAFYPGPLVEAADVGLLRDQPVFQLRLYPFQYNPLQRELHVYRRLRVLVTFPRAPHAPVRPDLVFERMLESTLRNYDALRPAMPHASYAQTDKPTSHKPSDDGPRVKLKIEDAGLYRVTYEDLVAIAPDLVQEDPRTLVLTHQGLTVPLLFEGETDGTFDAGDNFLFYGQSIQSVYTRYNVYWLQATDAPGLRMATRDGTPAGGVILDAFSDHRHYEEDAIYWRMPNGGDADHWFWDKLSVSSPDPVSVSYPFDLRHVAPQGPDGEVRLMLYGYTTGDHRIQLYLNDVPLLAEPAQTWGGREEKLYQVPVSQTLFVEGANELRVESILPPALAISEFYMNWFEITYQDTFVAESDTLLFSAATPGEQAFEVTDFSTQALELFDITDPAAPVQILNAAIESAAGGYRLRFSDDTTNGRIYLAQAAGQLSLPNLKRDEPSTWKSTDNGATYIIITHPDFYEVSETLADYRASQGETVVTVKTEDIYDEFNGGIYGPHAIQAFLKYAYANWSPKPIYVLLVGDASVDPKGNLVGSVPDMLPTYHVDAPLFGQAPNDSWYAKVNGDDNYPDIFVGRIPMLYPIGIKTVLNKVKMYEQSPPPGDWVQRAVLVAGDDPVFRQDMEVIADLLPDRMVPVKMYEYDPDTTIQAEASVGELLFAYSGHGSGGGRWWSPGPNRIFSRSLMRGMWNGDKLPFMTVANCLDGLFDRYDEIYVMAELFLLLDGKGGIASWAPASLGFPSTNSTISEELYKALLVDKQLTLGSAATTARARSIMQRPDLPLVLFEVFTFFGDPAVQLNLPPDLKLEGRVSPDPAVMGEFLTYTLVYTVSDALQARGLTLVTTLPEQVIYQSALPTPSSLYARTLTWDLGDTQTGRYTATVKARVTNTDLLHGQVLEGEARLSDENEGEQTIRILTPVHDAPIAGLSASNSAPNQVGAVTAFSATVTTGTNVSYTWDLGDGSPHRAGPVIQHVYANTGIYTAQVTATNGVSTRSQTTMVTIGDVPPNAGFVSSSPDKLGQTTTFWSTSTGTNLNYAWNFGDGSLPLNTAVPTVTHRYAQVGHYTVTLTVGNGEGNDTVSKRVAVLDSPEAGFSSSSPDALGGTTVFSNTSEGGGDIAEHVVYEWDFGDGTSSLARTPTHRYDALGIYTVSLTVHNSVGHDTYSETVTVTDVPISGLRAMNNSPTSLGDTTVLTASVEHGTSVVYRWAFGDGNTTLVAVGDPWQTTFVLEHTYSAVGVYTAYVTATNGVSTQTVSTTVSIVDVPPVARFVTSSPDKVGQTTTFRSISKGTNLSYRWAFGDGGVASSSTAPTATHVYSETGRYTAVLTASNAVGYSVVTGTVEVIAGVRAPVAGFLSSSPDELGQLTTFINISEDGGDDEEYIGYVWDFGDGSQSVEGHPSHEYAAPGYYEVVLTVTNSLASDTYRDRVTVTDVPIQGLAVQNDGPTQLGSATTLSAEVSAGTNVLYVWDLGDGSLTQHGAVVHHVYPNIGTYTAQVTATNSVNVQSQKAVVVIEDVPPRASFTSSSPDELGQTTRFHSTSTGTNLRYRWNFGDGSSPGFTQVPTTSHRYGAAGRYTVTLIVSNSAGSHVAFGEVKIERGIGIPQAGFSSSSPDALGETTVFSNTSEDGGDIAEHVVYEWDFGDGTSSLARTPTHRYDALGVYTVSLTVHNSVGHDTYSETVTVTDIPISGLRAINNSPTRLGDTTVLTASVEDGTNVVYTWTFGDGNTTSTSFKGCRRAAEQCGAWVEHVYPALGVYTAYVTATNGVSTQTVSTTVSIVNVLPVAKFISSSPDRIGQTTTFRSISEGTNLSYYWAFGDGSTMTSTMVFPTSVPTATHVYSEIGNYTAALTASNTVGYSVVTGTVEIIAEVRAPVAGFLSSSPDELGEPTTFINTSEDGGDDEEYIGYAWNFGDGGRSVEKHPTHEYAAPGHYEVALTITNSLVSDTYRDRVTITEVPIQGLAIEVEGPFTLGSVVALSATTTSGSNVSYAWAFGDGNLGVGKVITHIYGAVGTYTVVLTATNTRGQKVITSTISILDEPIQGLTIFHSAPTFLGDTMAFTPSIATGTSVTYLWDLGDGTTSTVKTPLHTYSAVGTYDIVLIATNSRGSRRNRETVFVYDVPISGLQMVAQTPIPVGNPASFSAVAATGTNIAYSWNFGDGGLSQRQHPFHTYQEVGDYTVVLTATNSSVPINGCSQVITKAISVFEPDESIAGLKLDNNSPTFLGSVTYFTATLTSGTNVHYGWEFGDGVRHTGFSEYVSHTYQTVGDYSVTLTATNNLGSKVVMDTASVLDVPIEGLSLGYEGRPEVNNPITFTAMITAGTNVVYEWDLGDGTLALGERLTHTYAFSDTYDVVLYAVNSASQAEISATLSVLSSQVSKPLLFLPLILCNQSL